MSGAIYMAAAGALNAKLRLEIISNNIANVNTSGYKQDRTSFSSFKLPDSVSYEGIKQNKINVSLPVSSGTQPDFRSGNIKYTGSRLDMAIEGNGFFSVKTPNGTMYTRNGSFTLDTDGVLITHDGFPVLSDGGEIKITDVNDLNFTVDEEGKITAENIGGGSKEIGALKIVDFDKPYLLKKSGGTLFAKQDPNVSEISPDNIKIKQSYLETSNVNAISAMVEMIDAIRGYESYQKIIQSMDNATGKAINELGRIG